MSPVQPTYGRANGCFGFPYDYRYPIYKQYYIRYFSLSMMYTILIGNYILVIFYLLKINKTYGHVAIVLTKRHGFISLHPSKKLFIGTH